MSHHDDDLCVNGICNNARWIPLCIHADDENFLDGDVDVELRHMTYSESLRSEFGSFDKKFRIITGDEGIMRSEEVFYQCENAWRILNFITEEEKYALDILVALREMEATTKNYYVRCEDCTDQDKEENNCYGDVHEIIAATLDYREDKEETERLYEGDQYKIDKLNEKFAEEMAELTNYHEFIEFTGEYGGEIYICANRIIKPWMDIAFRVMFDCFDENYNVTQWPSGKAMFGEWNKLVTSFQAMRSKLIPIRNEKMAKRSKTGK